MTGVQAAVFDMDGVVTDTSDVHAQAWKALFDTVLPQLVQGGVTAFDPVEEYRHLVDGRSHQDAVRSVLAARGLTLPEGERDDPAERLTVHGLASREQELFVRALQQAGVRAFPSTVTLLRRLRERGIPTALVTVNRNSVDVLTAAGILDLFDARVDGDDAERLELGVKPDPAVYLQAARELGVPPQGCMVVEDTVAGVQAARQSGFGLVVGVDRTGNRSRLEAAGADLVVADLAQLDLEVALSGRAAIPAAPVPWRAGASTEAGPWVLTYHGYDPEQEGTREALCTLANGYLGTRGAASECSADDVHYPGSYLAGVYNRLRTELDGRTLEDEHLVNVPNWLPLRFALNGGNWLTPDSPQLDGYRQELDVRRGVLTRVMHFTDPAGRRTQVTSERLVSQHAPHLAAIRTTFEAQNWSGPLRISSGLDAHVVNSGVAAYAGLANQHLQTTCTEATDGDTILLETVTTQSRITVAMAARTSVHVDGQQLPTMHRNLTQDADAIHQQLDLTLSPGIPVTTEKVVAVASSRDRGISTPTLAALSTLGGAATFEQLLADHERAWSERWSQFTLTVQAGERAQTALTFHAFHVLQTAPADPDSDAGLPARGLHGEGYRGHIFWDEMLVYPMLTLREPRLTRAVLHYRYRRLDAAREAARKLGLHGALFPWQSGSDGRDETPIQLFNPLGHSWLPDHSHRQRHVGLAIAYSVIQYVETTDDLTFLAEVGAELIVDILRCFASMAVYDPEADRYDIDGVMGPDEFHDGYPGRVGSGLRNNAYTNILLAWTLRRTAALLDRLGQVDGERTTRYLAIHAEERSRWDLLARRLRVPFHPDGVISQFEGYEELAELDWDRYRARYGDIGRLDLILAAEGDSPNNYRLAKQPDVLMLLYLLSAEDLRETLRRLGYELDKATVRRTVEFYLARTSHGSTLSRPVVSWVLARGQRARSWSMFNEALDSDLADIQGGTTREGIHLGAMAATVDLLLRCYTGLEIRDNQLWLHPDLPPELGHLGFQLGYRSHRIELELSPTLLTLHLPSLAVPPISVRVEGRPAVLHAGHTYHFPLGPEARLG